MTITSTARDQLRAFVRRILRLKEEQDILGADIREVYAEAKAMGFDKTALGQVVSIVRRREKDGDKFQELSAIVETYLLAFDGEPHARARAREKIEEIAPLVSHEAAHTDTSPAAIPPAGADAGNVHPASPRGPVPASPIFPEHTHPQDSPHQAPSGGVPASATEPERAAGVSGDPCDGDATMPAADLSIPDFLRRSVPDAALAAGGHGNV